MRPNLAIVERRISELVPYARNARTHSEAQVAELAGLIRRFGFTSPALIAEEDGEVIAGHGRILAADSLAMETIPCILLAGLSPNERRALRLADNRVALNSGWDLDLLRSELELLQADGEELDALGFDDKELGKLFADPDEIEVHEVETGPVEDRFWISIRGPLRDQAAALKRLQGVMGELADVEVELGTTAIDGF